MGRQRPDCLVDLDRGGRIVASTMNMAAVRPGSMETRVMTGVKEWKIGTKDPNGFSKMLKRKCFFRPRKLLPTREK